MLSLSRPLLVLSIVLGLCGKGLLSNAAGAPQNSKGKSKVRSMEILRTKAPKLLDEFEQKNDIEALKKAIELVELDDLGPPASREEIDAFRAAKLRAVLTFYNRIEPKMIAGFNPEELPSMTATPPEEAGLPSGVAPEAIKDPLVRGKRALLLKARASRILRVKR